MYPSIIQPPTKLSNPPETPDDNSCRVNIPTQCQLQINPFTGCNPLYFLGRVILLSRASIVLIVSVVLKLARLDVARQHFALEVLLVAVPQQSCFSVQRRGARKNVSTLPFVPQHCQYQYSLIRLPQQRLNTQQHTLRIQRRAPSTLLALPTRLQDIQADAPAHVDVGVVDGGFEEDFGRGVGVVCWEGEGEFEGEGGVGRVGGAEEGRVPVGEVGGGEGGDAGGGRGHEGHEFGLEAEKVSWVGLVWSRFFWGGGGVPFDDIAIGGSGGLGALCC